MDIIFKFILDNNKEYSLIIDDSIKLKVNFFVPYLTDAGFPTWWYDLPQILYSFFDEYDFSGKTIIPFNSHNGSQFSGTIETIQELEPDAVVVTDGFTVNERDVPEAKSDIDSWLSGLGF